MLSYQPEPDGGYAVLDDGRFCGTVRRQGRAWWGWAIDGVADASGQTRGAAAACLAARVRPWVDGLTLHEVGMGRTVVVRDRMIVGWVRRANRYGHHEAFAVDGMSLGRAPDRDAALALVRADVASRTVVEQGRLI